MLHASLPDQSWIDLVGDVDGVELSVWDLSGPPPREDLEVVVAPYMAGPDVLAGVSSAPSARLVQVLSAGYDGMIERLPEGVSLANAKGVHDAATAEIALGLVLASQRHLDLFVRQQAKGEWGPTDGAPGLADRRVLVLGYGSVGRAIAARLAPFEVTLTAVASRPRPGDDLVEQVHGVAGLHELAPSQDVVISVLPGSEETRGILGEELLAALPDGALVVNVGRGPALETAAALRHAGRLRFALDVTDPEPLPADHPLWSAPGVLISPHVGGRSTAFHPRAAALLRDQLTRAAAGSEPVNVVHDGRA